MPSFYSPTFTTSPTQFNFTSQAPFNFSHCHHPSPKSPKPRSNWFTHIVSSLCLDFFKVQVRSNQDPITSSRLNPAKTLHQSGQSCKQQKQAVTRAEKEPNQRGLISSQDPWSTRPRDHTGTRGGGWVASATIKTTLLEHGGGAPRPPLPPTLPLAPGHCCHHHHHHQGDPLWFSLPRIICSELKDQGGNTLLAKAPSFGNESEIISCNFCAYPVSGDFLSHRQEMEVLDISFSQTLWCLVGSQSQQRLAGWIS